MFRLTWPAICIAAFLAGFFVAAGVAVFGLLASHL